MSKRKKPEIAVGESSNAKADSELDADEGRVLLARFVREFVQPQKQEALMARIQRRSAKQVTLDYERYLPEACTEDVTAGKEILRWLSVDGAHSVCFFFPRNISRPVTRLDISFLREHVATSWPGLFVNFDAGRALAVTLDMERFRCETLRASRPRGR
jgi:hypothetical protein